MSTRSYSQSCRGDIIWLLRVGTVAIKRAEMNTAAAAAAKSLQSCLTPCDPRDGSPPGSPVPGKSTGVGCHFLLWPVPGNGCYLRNGKLAMYQSQHPKPWLPCNQSQRAVRRHWKRQANQKRAQSSHGASSIPRVFTHILRDPQGLGVSHNSRPEDHSGHVDGKDPAFATGRDTNGWTGLL